MAVKVRNRRLDPTFRKIVKVLEEYQDKRPGAEIETYRQNNVSVRIRIVDPEFRHKTRSEREEDIWALIEKLPDEVAAEISMLLLLTPEETEDSIANAEFEDPVPSRI